MWEQFEEQLVPLFEFLGIPSIILGPLIFILYILFKHTIPKMLARNTSVTGNLVANIVAQLFGEGNDVVKGVDELELVKVIKTLPTEIQQVLLKLTDGMIASTIAMDKKMNLLYDRTNEQMNDVKLLIGLLSQAMMAERLLKPQSSRLLKEISSKSTQMINRQTNVSIDIDSVVDTIRGPIQKVDTAVDTTIDTTIAEVPEAKTEIAETVNKTVDVVKDAVNDVNGVINEVKDTFTKEV